MSSLDNFVFEQILGEDSLSKRVAVLGRFEGQEGQAVVTAHRRHFEKDSLSKLLSGSTQTTLDFKNDIYSKFTGTATAELSLVTIDVVFPATKKHIAKATDQKFQMIRETPETYASVTLPYIRSIPAASIQWVYNVLDKKAEVERLIFEDPDAQLGFMLHPDLKWDQVTPENLYCLAICHRRDIQSLRDLTDAHLPLLQNIRAKGLQAIKEKYGIEEKYLRIYVHYQPSYYHFHVHFTHTAYPGGAVTGHAHLLDDIIDNISNICSDYYAKKVMNFHLGENHPLFKLLESASN
eukprot:CAMPEP_0196598230 /NCGR_PEP_ID=MMETSP1081-20130531/94203_1 /TAXON_ID=36882 /ORGANISM="Pyramimonas amylifera, Strain CCMP720" /LENGTH=292 /DNA_ID=CAMNT_0041923899 /DNA_START=641 /DNA_END=1519 /DNA_ORIENTATION=-